MACAAALDLELEIRYLRYIAVQSGPANTNAVESWTTDNQLEAELKTHKLACRACRRISSTAAA
jgi:hypothetical protein